MSGHDVIDVLRDMRDLDFDLGAGIGRRDAVDHRIGRIRRRRIATGGLAAAVLIAAGVTVGVTSGPDARLATHSPDPLASAAARHGLALSMRQPDGVVYRLVSVTTLDAPAQLTTTIQVPSALDMATVAATCDPAGSATSDQMADVSASAAGGLEDGSFFCGPAMDPIDLDLSGTAQTGGPAPLSISISNYTAAPQTTWAFGLYEWEIPASLVPPPALPPLPTTGGGWDLQQTFSGTLPARRSVTIHEPKGTRWAYLPVCSSALRYASATGANMTGLVTVSSDGKLREGMGCQVADLSSDVVEQELGVDWAEPNPTGTDVTITFNFPAGYDARAPAWELGIYVMKR